MDAERYEFCWIVDFPMYEIGEESGQLEFCHNPFSMPSGGLEVLLKAERGGRSTPEITADQYDLVCNGVELSSGAVRNHDPEIMVKALSWCGWGGGVKAKFPAMYNAFTYGAPPTRASPRGGPDGHAAGRRGLHPGGHPLPHEQECPGRDDGLPPPPWSKNNWTRSTSPSWETWRNKFSTALPRPPPLGRQAGTSVLRSKTLAHGGFTPPEHAKSIGARNRRGV